MPTIADRATKLVIGLLAKLPESAKSRIAGRLEEIDGQTVHPEVGMALRLLNSMPSPSFEDLPLDKARAQIDSEAWIFGSTTPVGRVEDIIIPTPDGSLRARRYDPHPDRAGDALLVYFHGGGWVLGSIDSTDSVCRYLCKHAGITVLSIDYRLAPEHRFPAGSDDALASYRYAVETAPSWGIPADRVMLGGDSAGGNLTVVTALRIRDELGDSVPPPFFQVAFFPVTDLAAKSASYQKFRDGYFLTEKQMDWYRDHYLGPDGDPRHPHASPAYADDLSNTGPIYIGVAGFDPLRDEGIAYAERLRAAGNDVELNIEPRHIHAYVNATGVGSTGTAALQCAVDAIKRRLQS